MKPYLQYLPVLALHCPPLAPKRKSPSEFCQLYSTVHANAWSHPKSSSSAQWHEQPPLCPKDASVSAVKFQSSDLSQKTHVRYYFTRWFHFHHHFSRSSWMNWPIHQHEGFVNSKLSGTRWVLYFSFSLSGPNISVVLSSRSTTLLQPFHWLSQLLMVCVGI